MKTMAFIATKERSDRFPGKNAAPLAGMPLVVHTVKVAHQAQAIGLFDSIVVSVDDYGQVTTALNHHNYTNWERQPEDIRATKPPVIKVLQRWLMDHVAETDSRPEAVCVLWPTSPLRTLKDLVASFRLLTPDVDAVMSVTWCRENPRTTCVLGTGNLVRLWQENQLRETGQTYVRHNGVVIWAWTEWLRRAEEFYDSDRIRAYGMAPEDAVDIDTRFDLEWAEFLLSRRAKA